MAFDTLTAALDARAAAQGDAVLFRFLATGEDETAALLWRRLRDDARRLALHLLGHAEPGDRALLAYAPGLDFIVAFFACLYAGVVAVPVQAPRRAQSLDKLRAIVGDSGLSLVLTDTDTARLLGDRLAAGEAGASLDVLDTRGWLAGLPHEGDAPPVALPPIGPDGLAFLQYTSGSTGTPKGVCVSHRQITHNSEMINAAFGHDERSVMVSWLPMFHDMGLIGTVIQPVYTGFPCVLMPPAAFIQKPMRWLKAVARHRATTSGGPNFGFDLCVQRFRPVDLDGVDLSSWRVAFNGAEPVRHATLDAFSHCFAPFGFDPRAHLPCYGMAEATLLVSGGPAFTGARTLWADSVASERGQARPVAGGDDARPIVSCGTVPGLGGAGVKIVDPDTGRACAESDIGEICLRGPHVLAGYWRGDGPAPLGAQAWVDPDDGCRYFRSGDLGFLCAGELHVCGRLKDLLIVKGRNLFPQDIERLVESTDAAFEPNASAAFTVEIGHEERLVVLQEIRRECRHRVDDDELRASARAAVAREFDVSLHELVLLPAHALPKTSSGKIQRRACRALYLDGRFSAIARAQRPAPSPIPSEVNNGNPCHATTPAR